MVACARSSSRANCVFSTTSGELNERQHRDEELRTGAARAFDELRIRRIHRRALLCRPANESGDDVRIKQIPVAGRATFTTHVEAVRHCTSKFSERGFERSVERSAVSRISIIATRVLSDSAEASLLHGREAQRRNAPIDLIGIGVLVEFTEGRIEKCRNDRGDARKIDTHVFASCERRANFGCQLTATRICHDISAKAIHKRNGHHIVPSGAPGRWTFAVGTVRSKSVPGTSRQSKRLPHSTRESPGASAAQDDERRLRSSEKVVERCKPEPSRRSDRAGTALKRPSNRTGWVDVIFATTPTSECACVSALTKISATESTTYSAVKPPSTRARLAHSSWRYGPMAAVASEPNARSGIVVSLPMPGRRNPRSARMAGRSFPASSREASSSPRATHVALGALRGARSRRARGSRRRARGRSRPRAIPNAPGR